MEHTPGPWVHEDDGFIYGEGAKVADPHCAQQDIAEREANARLIAAAPDLLDVARMLIESRDAPVPRFGLSDCVMRARAAIAKAEG